MITCSEASQFIWKLLHFRKKYSKEYWECSFYFVFFLENFLCLLHWFWFFSSVAMIIWLGVFLLKNWLPSQGRSHSPGPTGLRSCVWAVTSHAVWAFTGPPNYPKQVYYCTSVYSAALHLFPIAEEPKLTSIKQRKLFLILLVKINREN